MKNNLVTRRSVLRGTIQGVAVGVALPFLDCFLNENGTALAATGQELPVRFGTWFWGCGHTPDRWVPKTLGANYDLPPELEHLSAVRNHVNVLTGFDVKPDGKSNIPHVSGLFALRTGTTPNGETSDIPTLDVLIANAIGGSTRFRSIELAATGNARDSYSFKNTSTVNAAEVSPLALYQKIFGAEFQDPNAAEFKPDPRAMLRLSVLSAVKEDRDRLWKRVGYNDRVRLDEYLSSIRQVEGRLERQLQKPPAAEACAMPKMPGSLPLDYAIDNVTANHKMMAEILTMAVACNQTRVFNMVFSNARSNLRKPGTSSTHHTFTHEEPIDKSKGYQTHATWFIDQSLEAFATFVSTFASVREGGKSLLDNCLILAHSDSAEAKLHSMTGIPVLTAGAAGGRLKTGLHVAGKGEPVTRVGLTVQQIMGLPVGSWGTQSMQASKPVSEIVV